MARQRRTGKRGAGEPTLPLINIVFLMLIFFLAAAQVARPLDPELALVKTDDPELVPPADALVIHADGRMSWQGRAATPAEVMAARPVETGPLHDPARILPDRNAPARAVLAAARGFREAGAERVVIVTERALK